MKTSATQRIAREKTLSVQCQDRGVRHTRMAGGFTQGEVVGEPLTPRQPRLNVRYITYRSSLLIFINMCLLGSRCAWIMKLKGGP